MFFDLLLQIWSTFQPFFSGVLRLWPVWLLLILIPISAQVWLAYRQLLFKRAIGWVLLEIRIPRELKRNPQAMEQVFLSLHAIRNSPSNAKEKWWDGEVTLWFSFEIASLGGELHIYMRIPPKHRNMVEAAFYAQYPDAEIVEMKEDYMNRFPAKSISELLDKGYEFFGNELILAQDDGYPIRTYREMEAIEEESKVDPIAALLETMSKIKPPEFLIVQLLVRPLIDDRWLKAGRKMVDVLREKFGRRQMFSPAFGEFVMIDRTPGEIELMKAIGHNLSKPAFDSTLRYVYMSPRELYSDGFARRGTLSAFNQYAVEDRNRFRHNIKVWTRTQIYFYPYIFPKRRGYARKVTMYRNLRQARLEEETFMGTLFDVNLFNWGLALKDLKKFFMWFGSRKRPEMVLNVEALATIFHLPTMVVLTGPLIKRVEARKIGPPAGLPIYGEEGDELPGIK